MAEKYVVAKRPATLPLTDARRVSVNVGEGYPVGMVDEALVKRIEDGDEYTSALFEIGGKPEGADNKAFLAEVQDRIDADREELLQRSVEERLGQQRDPRQQLMDDGRTLPENGADIIADQRIAALDGEASPQTNTGEVKVFGAEEEPKSKGKTAKPADKPADAPAS